MLFPKEVGIPFICWNYHLVLKVQVLKGWVNKVIIHFLDILGKVILPVEFLKLNFELELLCCKLFEFANNILFWKENV